MQRMRDALEVRPAPRAFLTILTGLLTGLLTSSGRRLCFLSPSFPPFEPILIRYLDPAHGPGRAGLGPGLWAGPVGTAGWAGSYGPGRAD